MNRRARFENPVDRRICCEVERMSVHALLLQPAHLDLDLATLACMMSLEILFFVWRDFQASPDSCFLASHWSMKARSLSLEFLV